MRRQLDRLIGRYFGNIRIRKLLVIAALLALLVGAGVTSWLLISSADRIVHSVLETTAHNTTREIQREVERFLRTPDQIIENTVKAIEARRISPLSDISMLSHFWDKPHRGSEYSVSKIFFADPSGRHVSVGTTGIDTPANDWQFALSNADTFGRMTLYKSSDNGVPGALISRSREFDPRTREWYQKAVTSLGPIWTEVYWDFVTGRPTLTRAAAVYSEDGLIGVIGVDMYVEHIQQFMTTFPVSDTSQVFLVNDEGLLLVGYMPSAENNRLENPVDIRQAPFRHTRTSAKYIMAKQPDFWESQESINEHLHLDDTVGFLHVMPALKSVGLPWFIGIFIPEDEYRNQVTGQIFAIAPWALVGLLLALFTIFAFVHLITRPLKQLLKGANRIAVGDFDVKFDTNCANEVGDLARAVDNMRHSLRGSFQRLTEEKRNAESTLTAIADGVIKISNDGHITYMNGTAEEVTGWPSENAVGRRFEEVFNASDAHGKQPMNAAEIMQLLPTSGSFGREAILIQRQGNSIPVYCRASSVSDDHGKALGTILAFSDMSDQWKLRSELFRRSTHDTLTDLPNRNEFEKRLRTLLIDTRENGHEHVLAYMDLDQFRVINEAAGHLAGDQLLREVSQLLQRQFRSGASIARLGADVFAIVLEHCNSQDAAIRARSVLNVIESMNFKWNDRPFKIEGTIGLTSLTSDALSTANILREAESACFSAKAAGRNRVHIYNVNDERARLKHDERYWVDRIDEALNQDGFTLYYQTIRALDQTQNPGRHFEILLRMNDDSGELISPKRFLPAAERYDLASRIDRWVVENTFAWISQSPDCMQETDICAINLSGQSLGDDRFLTFVMDRLDHHQIRAEHLCFEVTETASIANLKNALILMKTLKLRGCLFALDDFGSGLSSFGYLKNLPVDYLKIDGQFVKDMLKDPLDFAMVRSINEIGQTMGMKTVAEFVENQAIENSLRDLGVDFAQGFLVDKPRPLETMGRELASQVS